MNTDNGAVTVGTIPEEIWNHRKWFIGKLQLPVLNSGKQSPALIYDETRKWSLYIPFEWTKSLKLKEGELKKFYWMWFDKNHAITIEKGTPVEKEPYW
ncbi:MAG: hypothetical protein ACREHC_08970 [Candidatus Levyibacteriota bacterium]